MSQIIISVCDICGHQSDLSKDDTYWAARHAKVVLELKADGQNGGYKWGDVCYDCRTTLINAIEKTVKLREGKG